MQHGAVLGRRGEHHHVVHAPTAKPRCTAVETPAPRRPLGPDRTLRPAPQVREGDAGHPGARHAGRPPAGRSRRAPPAVAAGRGAGPGPARWTGLPGEHLPTSRTTAADSPDRPSNPAAPSASRWERGTVVASTRAAAGSSRSTARRWAAPTSRCSGSPIDPSSPSPSKPARVVRSGATRRACRARPDHWGVRGENGRGTATTDDDRSGQSTTRAHAQEAPAWPARTALPQIRPAPLPSASSTSTSQQEMQARVPRVRLLGHLLPRAARRPRRAQAGAAPDPVPDGRDGPAPRPRRTSSAPGSSAR